MYQSWIRLAFVHWRYPEAALRPLVPPGLRVETFDGSAWVGLVPFLMAGVRAPGVPVVPWLSRFPETNVRTYVRDGRGRPGVWFLSLDASRLPAVLAARVGYGLPYFWSDMAVHVSPRRIGYRSRRRLPGPTAGANLEVEVGPALTEAERDERAHFLTARHRLFTTVPGGLATAEAEHPPWPLHRARLCDGQQTLVEAAGLPAPAGEPLVHGSPGVRVRIGMWHLLR